ncbi:hypothetical protein HOD08_01070 [bacterium]|nr:hypothetical protein [bacterium]
MSDTKITRLLLSKIVSVALLNMFFVSCCAIENEVRVLLDKSRKVENEIHESKTRINREARRLREKIYGEEVKNKWHGRKREIDFSKKNYEIKTVKKDKNVPDPLFPGLPHESENFEAMSNLEFGVSFRRATQGYLNSGASEEIPAVELGAKELLFEDLFFESKLLKAGTIADATNAGADNNPMKYLAVNDQKIKFTGKQQGWTVALSGRARIMDSKFILGVRVPMEYQVRDLSMTFPAVAAVSAKISVAGDWIRTYHASSLEAFVKDLFSKRGFTYADNMKAWGVESFHLFLIRPVEHKKVDFCEYGFDFGVPTARGRSTTDLWAPLIGNGGYGTFSAWGTVVFPKFAGSNSFCHGKLTFFIPRRNEMRIPVTKSFKTGYSSTTYESTLTQSDGNVFSELDSQVPAFAGTVGDVNVFPWPEVRIRAGQIFKNFISEKTAFAIFYDMLHKGSDSFGSAEGAPEADFGFMEQHSGITTHKLGISLKSKPSGSMQVEAACDYIFAGCNVPQYFSVHGAVAFDF